MTIEAGTRLGPYEVQDFIGQGAMGMVYRAYHAQLERTGAVKIMQAITPDQDSIARFRREAQSIAQMRHPNILNVFDFGEYQGTPYMIVEYVPGGSLAGRLKRGPVDRATAVELLAGIASGLDYAHSLGIVHRDVKPANVLLAKDGTPILADFGLAKLLQSASVKSMTGVTTGTPAYMAPEQVTGSQVGPPADRYSLATMAYELLTGAIPFDEEGVLELLYAQVHREPPPPSSRVPELGPRVDAVIVRGLAKDPSARWESCDAFVTALGQALAATPPPVVERTVVMAPPMALVAPAAPAPAPAAVAMPAVVSPAVVTKRSHKRRNAIIGAAVVLLLLFLVFAYAATRPPSLSLSASSVRPGDTIVATAKHLPANQVGEIQLLSTITTFAFRSDAFGDVSKRIQVPSDIDPGSHTVRICWNNHCHAQATLHVVGSVAQSTPGPVRSPSATSNPSRSPSPTPKATPSPSPIPPSITLSQSSVKLGGSVTVSGFHFSPVRSVTISFTQNVTTTQIGTATTGPNGNFVKSVQILVATGGPAVIKACDASSVCASHSITVTLV